MFRVIYPNRWFVWTIVMAVVIAAVLYWYFMMQAIRYRAMSANPEIEQQIFELKKKRLGQIDTTGWKTYRSEKYGFEIQYPSNFAFEESLLSDDVKTGKSFLITHPIFLRLFICPLSCGIDYSSLDAKEEKAINLGHMTARRRVFFNVLGIDAVVFDKIPSSLYPKFEVQLAPINAKEVIMPSEISLFDPILQTLKIIEPIDTSTWETYRNEEYGFEVKYPSDWEASDHSSGLLILKKTEGRLSGIQSFFAININKNYEINPKTSAVMEKISIGGRLGYKYFYQEGAGTSEVVLIQLGQDALQLSLDYFESKGSNFNDKKIAIQGVIDPILSTFKFIEPGNAIDASNWKTYRNEKYGFEFKYPPTVRVVKEKSRENFLSSFDLVTVDTEKDPYPTFSVQNPEYASTHGYCGDNGKYYPEIGMFLADFECRPHFVPWCTNTKLGQGHIQALFSSFGEAGGGAATNIIFTNKGYVIKISRFLQPYLDCFDETEEEITKVKVMQEEVEKILGSFKLIGDTMAKDLKCDIPFLGSLPTMIFPTTEATGRDDKALSVKLSSIIPESYGALVYVTENYESGLPNYRFDLGEINAGESELSVLSILHVAKERGMGSPHTATGGNWIHAHFYKIIGDKKIMLNEKYNANVQINLINTDSE